MSFYVYILKCADNSYYTGHTDNLEQRLAQHQQRYFKSCYTATRLPVELVYSQSFVTREEALASERQIKGWSRKKKEAMMRGDWNEVSRLAQNTLRQAALRQAQGDQVDSCSGEPAPVRGEPAPVRGEPAPVRGEPAPVRGEPAPVRGEPVEPHSRKKTSSK